MWCEKENSRVPKYCGTIKFHKLETACYYFWDLQGRGGFPDSEAKADWEAGKHIPDSPDSREGNTELDMDLAMATTLTQKVNFVCFVVLCVVIQMMQKVIFIF